MDKVEFGFPETDSLRKEGYFGVDMHFHTEYSMDGISKIPDIIKKLRKYKIGTVVTDHCEIAGAMRINKFKDVLVIPGIEFTCFEGSHILLYFYHADELKEFYNKTLQPSFTHSHYLSSLKTPELLDIALDQNCLICTPHPYVPDVLGIGRHGFDMNKISKKIHAIEVINGYNPHRYNLRALRWAKETKKAVTAGTDGHMTSELGRCLTFAQADDREGFLNALKKKKTIARGHEHRLYETILTVPVREERILKDVVTHHEIKTYTKSFFLRELRTMKEKRKLRKDRLVEHYLRHHRLFPVHR